MGKDVIIRSCGVRLSVSRGCTNTYDIGCGPPNKTAYLMFREGRIGTEGSFRD